MISVGRKEGTVEEAEAKMLHKVFDFGDRPVYEVMVPRLEVAAIEQGSSIADFLKLYTETPLSRFPVYKENMDNVAGILSVKDVLMARAKGTINYDSTIDDIVRPAYFTPETKLINELFFEMRDNNYRMAVVVVLLIRALHIPLSLLGGAFYFLDRESLAARDIREEVIEGLPGPGGGAP